MAYIEYIDEVVSTNVTCDVYGRATVEVNGRLIAKADSRGGWKRLNEAILRTQESLYKRGSLSELLKEFPPLR